MCLVNGWTCVGGGRLNVCEWIGDVLDVCV